jgi:macrolide-specific efflux system membrane fusion protein
MTKKRIWWGVIVLVIVGGGYYWYKKSHPATKPLQYVTAPAETGTLLVTVTGSGQVAPRTQVDLKPVVAGDAINVINVYVKNDQKVKKNELIALLDTKDAQKSIRDAQLSLSSAKNKYTQTKKTSTSTKYDRKAQEISLEGSQNNLSDAQAKLKDYSIRAPFDGIVTGLSVEVGDSVSRASVLATVITTDLIAKVALNEVDVSQVKVGDKTTMTFDALPGITATGKITKLDTIGTASQGVVSYNAEITFDSQVDLLKPEMSVAAAITTNVKQNVLVVPNSAVKSRNNQSYVETLKNGAPQQINVEVGSANNTETEIVNGIKNGEEIITQTIDPNIASATSQSSGLRLPGLGGGGGRGN